jgi:hypothetical protein
MQSEPRRGQTAAAGGDIALPLLPLPPARAGVMVINILSRSAFSIRSSRYSRQGDRTGLAVAIDKGDLDRRTDCYFGDICQLFLSWRAGSSMRFDVFLALT